MSDAITANISRQSGLLQELTLISNNIANASTDGFKREAAIFAEFVSRRDGDPSVSMGSLRGHYTDVSQGSLVRTDGVLDLAIDGEGWFAVEKRGDVFLTRAGRFLRNAEGQLTTPDGYRVLDDGGAPISVPETTVDISISSDGTVTADGVGVGQIGVLTTNTEDLTRAGENLWKTQGTLRFQDFPQIRQGFVESSNVSPVVEMARLIEVQRLYEMGASLQSDEHERISRFIETLSRQ